MITLLTIMFLVGVGICMGFLVIPFLMLISHLLFGEEE